jgi:YceI-like domain
MFGSDGGPRAVDQGGQADRTSPRKRHWWRWILGGGVALMALVLLAAVLVIKSQRSLPPLALPGGTVRAPAGPLGGTWIAAPGSKAGFRVQEHALGFSNAVVGRTDAVTGTLVISGDRVVRAAFRIDLTAVTVGGKAQPQFARSLGTRADPVATVTLLRPVTLGPGFAGGSVATVTVPGRLALHQVSRTVTVTLSGRRAGSTLQAAGSMPVVFSRWGIQGPAGFGVLGSLANHGVAEFLLILRR